MSAVDVMHLFCLCKLQARERDREREILLIKFLLRIKVD